MNFKTLMHTKHLKTIIGNGHYGKIYLVKIIDSDIKYVIKKIKCSNIKMINSVLNEIEVMIRLNNCQIKNVSKILDYQIDNNVNILMEHVNGIELFNYIKYELPLFNNNDKTIIIYNISVSLLNIIGSIHLNGIVHRDIRPENIIVRTGTNIHDISVVLIDFGLSLIIANNDIKFNQIAGSINYLYPKLVIDYFYLRKSSNHDLMMNDIWGYCLTLYTLINAKLLFESMNKINLIKQYLDFANSKYVDFIKTKIKDGIINYNECLILLFELIDNNIYNIEYVYNFLILMKIN